MPVIQTGGGLASAAEIVPWWTPGPEVAIPADVVGYPHFAPGPQALVLLWLENKIVHRIVVTDAGSVENHALLGDGELLAVSFVDHADEVDIYVVASAYDQYTVYTAHISPSGSWLDKVAESGTVGDALIAGGVDGAGRVAWVRDLDGALVRYRELGAAQWEIDRGPIAVPNPSGTAHQASVDPSGTLRLTWAEGSTPMLATLPADVDVFEASEVAADAAPVELVRSRSQTNAAGITLATWCGAGLSWVDPTRCVTRVRADDGTWSAPPTFEGAEPNSSVAYALDGPELLAAHCNDEGLHVTADLGSAPSEIAVWPCDPSDPTGFLARDGNGRINALVKDSSGESWFARQR
jgi:hypothetical protein